MRIECTFSLLALACIAVITPGCAHRTITSPNPGVNSPDGDMVWIPSGAFLMGCAPHEQDARNDEAPQHAVTLSHGFWMGTREVTQAQWQSVMGTMPWAGQKNVADDPCAPAVCVSWNDAQAFIGKLNERTGVHYRLPSEAEWEYACSDESQVLERDDGVLMLNMRGNMGTSCRGIALSHDAGSTWSPVQWDHALNECPCQASLIRYDARRILFANPDNTGDRFGAVERTRMTVRVSYDEGRTWPLKRLLHAGPSSYSCMIRLPDGGIAIVYEGGENHRREWIRFTRFSLEWLEGPATHP